MTPSNPSDKMIPVQEQRVNIVKRFHLWRAGMISPFVKTMSDPYEKIRFSKSLVHSVLERFLRSNQI